MKGIILAGGSGTRLYPITIPITKQLLPIYNKPMIYYPLSLLLLTEIKDILIICTKSDLENFKKLLGDGSQFGINLEYKVQDHPNGIAEAFIIGSEFIQEQPVCMVLGDNIFYGDDLINKLKRAKNIVEKENKSCVFCYAVKDPERYGVASFDLDGNDVVQIARTIKPSKRGELEITTINQIYLEKTRLKIQLLGRGFAWLDTGTFESLIEASTFIQTIENRQGLLIGSIEEIVYDLGYISDFQFSKLIEPYLKTEYGRYLQKKLIKKQSDY